MELLSKTGHVAVADLSERFAVSQTTVRSDLDLLEEQGMLTRTHGGALAIKSDLELSFDVRRRLHAEEKTRIGAAAADMIENGEAIILDASTTALAVARRAKKRRELTVLTNGIFIALELLESPSITVLMPGGFVRRDSASMVDSEAHDFIEDYNFQRGFFGAKGLTLEEGLTDVDSDEVAIKRDLVARSKEVVAIVDSSKWGHVGFASFASLDQLDCVITDDGAPSDVVRALQEAGVRVIVT
jgi:DeoR/GlpR family transcriptional regulator of sugar metabolism